jgi:hypothetical protein
MGSDATREEIGVGAYETAYNSGQSLTLDEAVALALGGKQPA